MIEAGEFSLSILGQQTPRHWRSTQDKGRPHRKPRHHHAGGKAPRHGGAQPLARAVLRPQGSQHLGKQHRNGFEFLDLRDVITAQIAVLHGNHAQRPPGTTHRYGKHRGIALLAGLRAIGKGRMVLRIRQIERRARGRHQADDALANPQPRLAHRVGAQPLGRGQFKDVAGLERIDRADFAHKFAGNEAHEFGKRSGATRHQLPQPAQ